MATPRSTCWRTSWRAGGRHGSTSGSCTSCRSPRTWWRSRTAAGSTGSSSYGPPPGWRAAGSGGLRLHVRSIGLSVEPSIRPARPHQAAGASPAARAQAPGGADGHPARRARARRGRDAQGAGGGHPDRARRGGGARPCGSPRPRDLHGDHAAAGGRAAEFYGAAYRPNAARILVTGDVTLAEARRLLTARFGGWERGAVAPLPEAAAPAPVARTVYLVDKPGAAQSVIRIGHVGVARATPDYFALQVLNTILGGAFTSRLNQNLRETHGYTYGAFSQFSAGRLAGPFVASASAVTAKTDSSLIEFLKELRRIRDEPVPDPELAKAKAYITLGLPADFETTGAAAARFRELLVYGLPLDYFAHYAERINAVTAADVQRVARQHIDPDHFDIVVVGDKSQIEAGIKALSEGPIVYRDLWGQEVK